MKTIRRIYFYLLSFIGLQLIVWGLYILLSGIWTSSLIGFQDILPTGLSLVLIGLPVFIIHFRVVQKDAATDEEENDSLVRAIFLFLTQITALGAISIGAFNLLEQFINLIFFPSTFDYRSLLDQIAIILLNLTVWWYLFSRLLPKEDYFQSNETYRITRRIYRYIWLVVATAITVINVQSQLSDIFRYTVKDWLFNYTNHSTLNISLIIVWTTIWAWTWNILINSFSKKEESQAAIRHILNLILSLITMATWLTSSGYFIFNLLTKLFEEEPVFYNFFYAFNIELSVFIPFFVLWLYYEQQLKYSLAELEDHNHQQLIKRIYSHIQSIAGNILTFIGLWSTISWLIDNSFGILPEYGGVYDKLCTGIALLIIGLPLWITHWHKLQLEITSPGNTGLIARKSTLRRFYLYFFVFGSVVGIMASAGSFFYKLLFIILGRHEPDLWHFIVSSLFYISIFVVWLIYHLKIMQNDNQIIKTNLQTENEILSIVMITTKPDTPIMEHMLKNIKSKYQFSKIKLLALTDEFDLTLLDEYQTMIISMQTIISNQDFSKQLEKFKGKMLVLPTQTDKIIPIADTSQDQLTHYVISALNQIKHGSEIKIRTPKSAIHIVAYIIGGFIALNLLWQLLIGILTAISD